MLTKRQKALLELLNHQEDFQTVAFFANKLGVSKRTIHSELGVIKEYLQSSGEYLEKKRGVGIAIRKQNKDSEPKHNEEPLNSYSTVARRIEIIKMLLFDEAVVSFNSLSERFMVSKTSITKDFQFIMKILNEGSNIQLKSDVHGTKIDGSEVDIQKAHLQFNRYLLSHSSIYFDEVISKKIKLLESYYGEQLISACTNILYSYVRENVNAISDHYVQNVLNVFIILVYRNLKGNHIEESKKTEVSDNKLFFEESAVQLMQKAALRLNFTYTNKDIEYLSQHLISNRFESMPVEKFDNEIVNRLLLRVSEALNIDFSNDKKLEAQLKSHIPPMIYRLRSNYKTENPFTSQIKTEFSLTFNTIWVVLSEYEKELKLSFDEDEIAFLTIYFQAAIERAKMNKKILIVCQMGIAASELLANRIKNVIPSFDTLEVGSIPELDHLDLDRFDLIISTIKIDIPGKKVIIVSPLLTDDDIQKISQAGYKPGKIKNVLTFSNGQHLRRFIQPEFIYINTDFATKEELIDKVGKDLIDKQYVLPEFVPSLKKRENLGGTDLPSGVAVPHGNPIYAQKTLIVVIKNRKKFKWDKYYVDITFLICISKQDTRQARNILSDIYNIVDHSDSLQGLRESFTIKSLLRTLGSDYDGGKE
ncbi:BglG family transcription antiterminator [Amphibacillus sediminis]|uniref:BglG family transcription antiterminator n=1 Tax=Amphibacillus sediminis TaxID=360185 RepID=UPI0008359486|nr:BglG family transcription antiterminator [Amphibacillus sediminis]